MDDIKSRINKIDELLNDNALLDNYIKDIENTPINVPFGLEDSLINKFGNNTITQLNTFLENSFKIFKIAVCTVFALVIWNTSLSKPILIEKIDKNTSIQMQFNIDNKLKSVSEFLLTPINLERNDR